MLRAYTTLMLGIFTELLFGSRKTGGGILPFVSPGERVTVSENARDCTDASPEAQSMLEDYNWTPKQFEAICHLGTKHGDARIEFPSPFADRPKCSANATMTWHVARNRAGQRVRGPAMIVLDVLQAGNFISGYIGRSLAHQGIHAFVMDLPHLRKRSVGGRDCETLLHATRQAIVDARRARDVAAAMPGVDGRIGIQGTSFGGFVASIAAGLDNAFDVTCLALCGGNIYDILTEGRVESAKLKRRLNEGGITDMNQMKKFLWQIEPMRVAHRLNPRRTFLWVARRDQVVPLVRSKDLAHAIGLLPDHMQTLSGCHYTCALASPWWTQRLIGSVKQVWNRETSDAQVPSRAHVGQAMPAAG